jgi:hypothetical protein
MKHLHRRNSQRMQFVIHRRRQQRINVVNERYVGPEAMNCVGNLAAAPPRINALGEEGGFLKNVEGLGLVVMPGVEQHLVAVALEQLPLRLNY